MAPTRDGLKAMKRSQLQQLCKQNRLRGNLKTAELVDLLAAHYEQQNRISERTTGSSAPSPSPPSHNPQDENREPPARHASVLGSSSSQEKAGSNLDVGDPTPAQIAGPAQPTSTRISALESLCTRLLGQVSTATTTITTLQDRLDAAEHSITTLSSQLTDTRAQLDAAHTQIRILRSSLTASDNLATETVTSITGDLTAVRQLAENVGSRLLQVKEQWQHDFDELARQVAEPDDRLLFEPAVLPRARSRSHRSRSREASGSSTVSWAAHQQAIAGGLGIPPVRLFGASSGSNQPGEPGPEEDRPVPSTSTQPRLAPSALPKEQVGEGRSFNGGSGPSSSCLSSGASVPRSFPCEDRLAMSVAEPSRPARQTSVPRESSKAAGKRPASPIPIPVNPRVEADNARATKRARYTATAQHGELNTNNLTDESPSLNSLSAGASNSTVDSPVFPPSPVVEPSTPPSKRPATLLPPVEIISTPSPNVNSQTTVAMAMQKDFGDPHGFATTPRPPVEGPGSPSPRRNAARRFIVDAPPPLLTFTSTDSPEKPLMSTPALDRTKSKASLRRSLEPPTRAGPSSPATLMIGKGKVVRASLDTETALAVLPSRSSSEDADGDVTMTVTASSTNLVALQRGTVTPAVETPSRPTASRPSSFFASKGDFPTSGAYPALAPPPPPPHNYVASASSRRLGSAPLLTATPLLRDADGPIDYSADPDEPKATRESTPTFTNNDGRSIWSKWRNVNPPATSGNATWSRRWGM